jgi:rare lipoprotein A (peptidoglycan hydrolase)
MRVLASADGAVLETADAKVDVFHRVLASWYGPGGRTACGEELTSKTLGVANKTLPCGTLVTFRYRHRTLRVPVIDRGPFVAGRDYDLTYATKRKLHAGDLTELWASR